MPIGIRFTPLPLTLILTQTRHIYVGDERTPEPSLRNFGKTPSTVI